MHRVKYSNKSKNISVSSICKKVGMSRQNYYKERKNYKKQEIDENQIIKLVKSERKMQSRLGGRKVIKLIKNELTCSGISVGRDRFFNLLKKNDMLIEKKKSVPKTTNSKHNLPVFHNLVKDMEITEPNQAWCSDLTYIRTAEGFMYAALITDMYSRKIVGAHIGDSLESIGCLKALEKAISCLPAGMHPIHHSDRGTQYCCHSYVNKLMEQGLKVSMTEENHCYENAMAERVNGILKQEYELDYTFKTKEQARVAFYQAVNLYNTRRPHMSLDYQFPAEVHEKVA
jgi:putative transposase